jgi:hypothetical protein
MIYTSTIFHHQMAENATKRVYGHHIYRQSLIWFSYIVAHFYSRKMPSVASQSGIAFPKQMRSCPAMTLMPLVL